MLRAPAAAGRRPLLAGRAARALPGCRCGRRARARRARGCGGCRRSAARVGARRRLPAARDGGAARRRRRAAALARGVLQAPRAQPRDSGAAAAAAGPCACCSPPPAPAPTRPPPPRCRLRPRPHPGGGAPHAPAPPPAARSRRAEERPDDDPLEDALTALPYSQLVRAARARGVGPNAPRPLKADVIAALLGALRAEGAAELVRVRGRRRAPQARVAARAFPRPRRARPNAAAASAHPPTHPPTRPAAAARRHPR